MQSIELALAYQTSATHVYGLLKSAGHSPVLSERLLVAALELQQRPGSSDLLERTRSFFSSAVVMVPDGLDTLPATWLQQVPAILWRSRKPHWTSQPYMIPRLSGEQGVMCVSFAQELPNAEDRLTAWDRLRVDLNLELRPNLWQPLSKSLQRRLWNGRADLARNYSHPPRSLLNRPVTGWRSFHPEPFLAGNPCLPEQPTEESRPDVPFVLVGNN